jgi:carboxylesterase type B
MPSVKPPFIPLTRRPKIPFFSDDTVSYSEDCLSINVVRPAGIPHSQKLPVAVWIHGGGFSIGSSADRIYNLSDLVNTSQQLHMPVIVASINYRLGVLGFLAGSELAAEGNVNLGLHDQRLALRWVQENIVAFGGDPENVTIFGESAYSAIY